jgi:hypothetical protein
MAASLPKSEKRRAAVGGIVMSNKQIYMDQLYWTDEKIKFLQALYASLQWFYNALEKIEPAAILDELTLQSEYRTEIDNIDQKLQKLQDAGALEIGSDEPQRRAALDEKSAQYQILLAKTAALNKKAIAKTQELLLMHKNTKSAVSRKNIIPNFSILNNHLTGYIYDYKEGNRI